MEKFMKKILFALLIALPAQVFACDDEEMVVSQRMESSIRQVSSGTNYQIKYSGQVDEMVFVKVYNNNQYSVIPVINGILPHSRGNGVLDYDTGYPFENYRQSYEQKGYLVYSRNRQQTNSNYYNQKATNPYRESDLYAKEEQIVEEKPQTAPAAPAPKPKPQVAKRTCPITGEEASSKYFLTIGNKKVYFCCEDCVNKAKEQILGTAEKPVTPEAPSAEIKPAETQPENVTPIEDQNVTPVEAAEKCPMSGEPVSKDIFLEINGKKVYFCCEGCKTEAQKAITTVQSLSK